MSEAAPLLQMQGIRKSFVGVEVLHGVDLELKAGEIHAIVGENGAGKSTLVKVLAGVHPPDEGTIRIDGEPVTFHHPYAAQAAGVGIVYQEFNLLPDRTVAENVFVGREPVKRGIVDRRGMERATAALLEEVGETSFGPRTLVRRLSVAQQQVVEVVKARSLDARILVLDEPTAALADHEVELLFTLVRRLQERGIGMLYISHRLREVFALADCITVLKDGGLVKTLPTGETDSRGLVNLMVGRELDGYFPPRGEPSEFGDVRLAVSGLSTGVLHDVSLKVRAGEIVGLAGLVGSGRSEVARLIFGADPLDAGGIELEGRAVRVRGPGHAARLGIALVPESRKEEGLLMIRSIRENVTLATLPRYATAGVVRRDQERRRAEDLARRLDVRAPSTKARVGSLSGGNQQKVLFAKWLAAEPKLLIADEPTRGIDVAAKQQIHALIADLAEAGMAVLLISSEIEEVLGLAHRVLVMRRGRVVDEFAGGAATQETVMRAAFAAPPTEGDATP
jgi:ABC-type sugar transport system ATPase subunit